MITAKQLYNYLDTVFPFETQEKWDNSGLLVDSAAQTGRVLCCLDVTKQAVEMAVKENCKIILSHHPVIFSGIKSLDGSSILVQLVKNDISVISAHTNFDKYSLGTSWRLAQHCGICGETVLDGYMVTVEMENKTDFDSFIASVKEKTQIPLQYVKAAETVSKVMVVAGSGKDMTSEIVAAGCDCIVTGESSYHDMLDLSQLGVSCICLGHDESEKISVETLADTVKTGFPQVETVCYIAEGIVKYI
jgi:dinuclear metal center YbgI/SA1388 family protein